MPAFGRYGGPSAVESFKENMEENVKLVDKYKDHLDDPQDVRFAINLISFYEQKGYLTEKQMFYITKFWQQINEMGYGG